jgi:hypothetical protein
MALGALQLERMLREARESLSHVEISVIGLADMHKGKLDEVTISTLAKLKKLPSTHYRSIPQLKLTHFLLMGLICRNASSGSWKREQLEKLKKVIL